MPVREMFPPLALIDWVMLMPLKPPLPVPLAIKLMLLPWVMMLPATVIFFPAVSEMEPVWLPEPVVRLPPLRLIVPPEPTCED